MAAAEQIQKIYAAVDYLLYLTLGEGQQNDINYAIYMLEQLRLESSHVLAGRGYDSHRLIDYICKAECQQFLREGAQNLKDIVFALFQS